jgi:hypothetical protein
MCNCAKVSGSVFAICGIQMTRTLPFVYEAYAHVRIVFVLTRESEEERKNLAHMCTWAHFCHVLACVAA